MELAAILERMCEDTANDADLAELDKRVGTVADSARCNLALQHQLVVGSIAELFPDQAAAHTHAVTRPVEPELIAGHRRHRGRPMPCSTSAAARSNRTGATTPSTPGKWPATRFPQRSTEAFE